MMAEALHLIGKIKMKQGKARPAMMFFERALVVNPINSVHLVALGDAMHALEMPHDALRYYESAVQDFNGGANDIIIDKGTSKQSGQRHISTYLAGLAMCGYIYHQVPVLNPQHYIYHQVRVLYLNVSFFYTRVWVQYRFQCYCQHATRLLEEGSPHYASHLSITSIALIFLLQNFRDMERARDAYDVVFSIQPNHARATDNKCALLVAEGKMQEAIELHQKLVENDKTHLVRPCSYFNALFPKESDLIHGGRKNSSSIEEVHDPPFSLVWAQMDCSHPPLNVCHEEGQLHLIVESIVQANVLLPFVHGCRGSLYVLRHAPST